MRKLAMPFVTKPKAALFGLALCFCLAISPSAAQEASPSPNATAASPPSQTQLNHQIAGKATYSLPTPSTGFILATAALLATDEETVTWFHKPLPDPSRLESLRKNGRKDAIFTAAFMASVWLADSFSGHNGAKRALTAVAQSTVLTESLKKLVGRKRPFEAGTSTVCKPLKGYHSFPSGHAALAFAAAGAVGSAYSDLRALLYAGAAAVAVSRLTGGYHYPSDVFVGAAIGLEAARRANRNFGGFVRFRF
jgi:undecaprenyl-diphosphatase